MAVAPTFRVDGRTRERLLPGSLKRILDPEGKVPPGMVRVESASGLDGFYIDRYEVTNRQYKEFVDKGGGTAIAGTGSSLFSGNGKALNWEQAMAEFVDQTGRPGPFTWQARAYPEGQEAYPVSGVSWYEAAAYAEYAGRSLPTATHWATAMGVGTPLLAGALARSWLAPVSNFGRQRPGCHRELHEHDRLWRLRYGRERAGVGAL